MLVIRQSGEEVELSSSAHELRAIADKIVALIASSEQSIFFPAVRADPAPYERSLAGFAVRRATGKTLVSVSGEHLAVTGCDESLASFATWFSATSQSGAGAHSHFEPQSSDPYHSSASVALIVAAE